MMCWERVVNQSFGPRRTCRDWWNVGKGREDVTSLSLDKTCALLRGTSETSVTGQASSRLSSKTRPSNIKPSAPTALRNDLKSTCEAPPSNYTSPSLLNVFWRDWLHGRVVYHFCLHISSRGWLKSVGLPR